MYIPNTSWTHRRTRPLIENGNIHFATEQCTCGFETTERLPGSNASMNAARHEQEDHEGNCAA